MRKHFSCRNEKPESGERGDRHCCIVAVVDQVMYFFNTDTSLICLLCIPHFLLRILMPVLNYDLSELWFYRFISRLLCVGLLFSWYRHTGMLVSQVLCQIKTDPTFPVRCPQMLGRWYRTQRRNIDVLKAHREAQIRVLTLVIVNLSVLNHYCVAYQYRPCL